MRIARQGYRFIVGLAALGGLSYVFSLPTALTVFLFGAAVFVSFFFRDPTRVPPEGDGLLLSPGDGKVDYVGPGERDPDHLQISIFLSIFDVHINRSPMNAEVRKIRYRPGKFLTALDPKSGRLNEQNELELVDGDFSIKVRQIAGIVARRIVCAVSEHDRLERGQRFGLIQFGSRMEIILPQGTATRVQVGDRVRGGETVIAERAR